jgi:hypothetical protein
MAQGQRQNGIAKSGKERAWQLESERRSSTSYLSPNTPLMIRD